MCGDSFISDYLDRVNAIADNLALSGSKVDEGDLVAVVMNNVGALLETTVSSA